MVRIDMLTEKEQGPYQDFLDRCNYCSVQYSLDWRNTIGEMGKDEPFFVVAKENDKIVGVLPLYYYKSKLGNLLTTIAWHTISGIMFSSTSTDRETERTRYKALLDHSIDLAKELDCVVLSIAANPFLGDSRCYLEYFEPNYVMENFIQYIDLNEIFDKQGNTVHPNYVGRSNLSRNLRYAELQGTTISDEPTKDNVEGFFRVYSKRMKELNATPIPREMFNSIHKNMISRGKGKFVFASAQEKVISTALVIFNDRVMDDYTMCADSEYKELRSNFLVMHQILKWANKKGISILNWQSSPRRGNGVYKWKEQWGSRELTFPYFTKILGDVSEWKNLSLKELKEAYNFHYVLPFNLLKSEKKFTTKDELTSFLLAC